MRADGRERRRALRRRPASDEPLARIRLRAGREVDVLDISNSGALVEGPARLRPGTHVDVHVVTRDGRVLVRSRVARAYVCAVDAEQVCYRGALAFEHAVDTTPAGYVLPDVLADLAASPGSTYPDAEASADSISINTSTI
jgi:hypothetical protein